MSEIARFKCISSDKDAKTNAKKVVLVPEFIDSDTGAKTREIDPKTQLVLTDPTGEILRGFLPDKNYNFHFTELSDSKR
jgi:hypothetical protein